MLMLHYLMAKYLYGVGSIKINKKKERLSYIIKRQINGKS